VLHRLLELVEAIREKPVRDTIAEVMEDSPAVTALELLLRRDVREAADARLWPTTATYSKNRWLVAGGTHLLPL
jgi:hypothetical protein